MRARPEIRTLVIIAVSVACAVTASAAEQTAVFAGGCFWGVEAVFEHVKGVNSVVSGYSGGAQESANYDMVSSGRTDHAESVMIKFDDRAITYQQLLFIFFSVAHDPTQLNKQGPDHGRQYRSVIFYMDDRQKNEGSAFIKAINDSKALSKPVATEIVPFAAFYKAEAEHQDFVRNNPTNEYVVFNDLPKIKELKKKFPKLYKN